MHNFADVPKELSVTHVQRSGSSYVRTRCGTLAHRYTSATGGLLRTPVQLRSEPGRQQSDDTGCKQTQETTQSPLFIRQLNVSGGILLSCPSF